MSDDFEVIEYPDDYDNWKPNMPPLRAERAKEMFKFLDRRGKDKAGWTKALTIHTETGIPYRDISYIANKYGDKVISSTRGYMLVDRAQAGDIYEAYKMKMAAVETATIRSAKLFRMLPQDTKEREMHNLMDVYAIADRFQVSVDAVRSWVHDLSAEFPEPRITNGNIAFWDADVVEAWGVTDKGRSRI